MSIADQLDPQNVMDDVIRQGAPSLVPPSGPISGPDMMDRMIRQNVYAPKPQPKQAAPDDLSKFGRDPTAPADLAKFGRDPEAAGPPAPPPSDPAAEQLARAQAREEARKAQEAPPPPLSPEAIAGINATPPAQPQPQQPGVGYGVPGVDMEQPPPEPAPPPGTPPATARTMSPAEQMALRQKIATQPMGLGQIAGTAAQRGQQEAWGDITGAFGEWKKQKDYRQPDYVDTLLGKKMLADGGWKSADWWTAHLFNMGGGMSPAIAASFAGIPAPAAFGVTSALQSLVPEYQHALDQGLTENQAVKQAWEVSGIDGAVGAVLGYIPGGVEQGATLKEAILKGLRNMGLVAPGAMVAGEKAKATVRGEPYGLPEAAETAAFGAATGLALSAPHLLGAMGRDPAKPVDQAKPGDQTQPDTGTVTPPGPGPTPDTGADAGARAAAEAAAAGLASQKKAGAFHIDPNASDEDVMRQTGMPDALFAEMSAADRKTLADEIRRQFAEQQAGDTGAQPDQAAGQPSAGAPPRPDAQAEPPPAGPQPGTEPPKPPPGPDPTDPNAQTFEQRARDFALKREAARAQARQDEAARQRAETTPEERLRSKMETVAAHYGEHGADEIKSWSDEKLKDYVTQKTTKPADDDAILKRAGVPPEEAAAMSPEEKAKTAEEARGYGVHAGPEPVQEGSRDAPIDVKTAEDVARAAAAADQEHTPAQGEANNVARGHMRWQGLDITIEAPAGGVRRGTNPKTGEPWETSHSVPYGYIKGTEGADGMHVDAFMGPNPESPVVYVMDEKDEGTGAFRQHKAFIGFHSPLEAIQAYLGTSTKRPEHVGGMRMMPAEEFKTWLKEGDTKAPISEAMGEPKVDKEVNNGAQAADDTDIPAELHRAAVEGALRAGGIDPASVLPEDIDRAAKIHAEEGAPAEEAFQVAVVRGLVDDGLIKPETVAESIGNEAAEDLLHPGERAQRELRPQTRSAAAGGEAAEKPGELGKGRTEPGEKPSGERGGSAESAKTDEAAKPVRTAEAAESDTGNATGATDGRAAVEHTTGRKPGAANPEKPAGAKPESGGLHPAEHQTAADAAGAALIGERVNKIPEHNVTAADGTKVKTVPVVVEAKDLITSSDAGYDKALQPRQRDRAASQAQIREIATRLDPERLGYSSEADRGAPIVGPDRLVESGNGRVAALRTLYGVSNAPNIKKYKAWLTSQGVDVSKYKEPVLVRQRLTNLSADERQDFTVSANQSATLSMSAPERALADAGHISASMLDMVADGENLGSLENRRFVRAFIASVPATERGALTDTDGNLSSEGLTRVRNAVLAKAYGDADVISRITESTDDEVKSISNALTAAAPMWAKLRNDIEAGTVRRDLDLTDDLMEAVKRTADLRGRGQKLSDFLAQNDAFDHLKGPVEGFMRWFYDPAGKRAAAAGKIADKLRFYADQARKVTDDPDLGLDIPKVEAHEIQSMAQERGAGVRPGVEAGRPQAGRSGSGEGRAGFAGEQPRPGLADNPRDLFTEPGAEGKPQSVIPGTERISSADLAKRRAAQPLKPKVAQKPLDGGLFGETGKQGGLFDQPVAKPAGAPQIKAEEQGNGTGSEGLRAGAPGVPGAKPAGRARGIAQRPGGPDQLSLFGGDAGARPGANAPRPDEQSAGGAKPPVPSEDSGVSKPPSLGAGNRPKGNRPSAGPRAEGVSEAAKKIAERSRLNYRITDEDHIGEGGPKAKVRGNLDAIRTLKQIEEEDRLPSPEEKQKLVKYVGWGAFAQDVFASHKPEWKEERQALRALLTDEEFEAAKGSTLNAHYTSPDVIRGMWDALDHLGFKGGLAIEPSAGVGHFIGLIPDKMAPKTAWTAVELDPITGRIAHALYGGTEVTVQGYEELKRPSNYYDLAISNVPFGDYNISEKPYGAYPIHDFFFVKSLDKVRPGGVVAFVTSRYTMDKVDDGVRRTLARSADLVGAIRLPGGKKGAFAGNAGTEVTTDVLFLRKKVPGETPFPGADWMGLKQVETKDGPVNVNQYFADHPDMMLGEMRLTGTMYGKNEPVLVGDTEGLREKIAGAAQANMEKGALMPRAEKPPETIGTDEMEGPVKDGAFFMKDGKLWQRRAGRGYEHPLSTEDHDRVRRMVGMRDQINDLLAKQLAGSPGAEVRGKLKAAYDAFVKKHGPINLETTTVTSRLNKAGEPVTITRQPNLAKFLPDPDVWKVAAIENYDQETGKAKPADILLKDVIAPPQERKINGPADALAASLDDTGRIDLDHIADSLNLDSREAAAQALGDLIFQNPDGRQFETAADYLSGNVVQKLEEARAIAQDDKGYARNVAALEKVQPTPLTRHDITAQFGAPWIPEHAYEAFFKDALGAGGKVTVKRTPVTGEWKVSLPLGVARDAHSKYGTDRVSVDKVAASAMNNTQISVYDKDADGKAVINQAATELARLKANALKESFTGDQDSGIDGWVWKDHDRAQELEGVYNRTHNNLVPQKFDGTHLTLPGLNPDFATRQHRKDAVWRMVQRGNTLLAHVVGSGKTVTMIAGGMEMKRLGLIRKPAYVVPNHMLEQFSREFIQAYPNAKILVASKEESSRENRKAFLAKVSANDWDGVIITHDSFGRINMAHDWRKRFILDQMNELDRIMKAESADSGKGSPTVKGLEKAKKRLQAKLDKLLNEDRKDEGTTFEESGIDHLFVDEAHKFKNLNFLTRMQRIKGLSQGDSQRAEDLFLKIRYLEQKRPGRSAVFATGTPVSNTMAELWTMQRYLQLDKLKERELDTFDNWASTFGRVVNNMELSADGRTFKEVSSFSKFVNVPELISLYSEIADTKTADMLNLPRPEVRSPNGTPGIEIQEAKPSAAEEAYINDLVKLAESLKGKRPLPGEPNMLSVVTRGRKVATDGRLVGIPDINPVGKLSLAVKNIHDIWKNGKEPGTVQMVFLDMGVPQSRSGPSKTPGQRDLERQIREHEKETGNKVTRLKGKPETPQEFVDWLEAAAAGHVEGEDPNAAPPRVDLYADIKGRLIAMGIPAKEIAAIHDATDDAKKAKLFSRVRSGDVRVLLGSTEKMGVGTNVQDRLIAMHHLDAPWKPAEVEQRDGRIVRQGNKNKQVRILRYVTAKSFDAFMWQKLDTKSKFIGQVLSGAKGSRTAEDIDNPLPEAAEMKAAASGDPRIMEHAELDRVVRQLTAQRRAFEQTKDRAAWEQKSAKSALDMYEKDLPEAQADSAQAQDLAGPKFKVTLGADEVTDRKEAGERILKGLLALDPKLFYSPKVVKLGSMSGFDMNVKLNHAYYDGTSYLEAEASLRNGGGRGYAGLGNFPVTAQTDPAGLMRRFENILANVRGAGARLERNIASERDNLERIEKTLAESWPKEKEYRGAIAKLEALTQAMKGDPEKQSFSDLVHQPDAQPEQILAHPYMAKARASIKAAVDTSTPEQLADPAWRASRVYDFNGERVQGFDEAARRLTEIARAYSTNGPVRNERKALFIIGPPAASKSYFAERAARQMGAAIPDPDDAKKIIPEFKGGVNSGGVHEESSALSKAAMAPLLDAGANIVLPKVGLDPASLSKQIRLLKEMGYAVDLVSLSVKPEEALRRGMRRFIHSGRFIRPENFLEGASKPDENYHIIKREGILHDTAQIDVNPPKGQHVIVDGSGPLADAFAGGEDQGQTPDGGAGRGAGAPEGQTQDLTLADSGRALTSAAGRDLGSFSPSGRSPIAREAQDYVVAQGKFTGNEHLVAIDHNGKVVGTKEGGSQDVEIEGALAEALSDPKSSIVLHHNHPSDLGLSPNDLAMLAYPGMAAVWAHGHGGNVARAALTPHARARLAKLGNTQQIMNGLYKMARATLDSVYRPVQDAVNQGRVSIDGAARARVEVMVRALQRGGIFDYQTNADIDHIIDDLGLEPYIEKAARAAAGVLNVPGFHPAGRELNDGRSSGRSHPGDVGASFEKGRSLAAPVREQARAARNRPKNGRAQAPGEPEQLRLLDNAPAFTSPPPSASGPQPPRPITGALVKTAPAKAFKNFWASTFQPELVSDRAFAADPLFAKYRAASVQEKDAIYHESEKDWAYWNKRPDSERIRFLDDMETAGYGALPPDTEQAAMAKRYRTMLDANWAEEKKYGSQAAFVEDYFPHVWEKPSEWESYAATKTAQLGPTWFQKKRTIDYITDGLAAGMKLKFTNPADIVTHRLLSGVDMRQRMQLLQDLKRMGLAWEGAQGGDHLVRRGWRAINAPDRKQWVIAPDVQLLWKNAVEAKGLWQAEHVGGSLFRGWMALKNVWVPVKLALSAFHPLHVLHINYSDGMARAFGDVMQGKDAVGALRSLGQGFVGPMSAAPGASTGAIAGALLGSATPIGPYWGGLAGAFTGAAVYGAAKRAGMPAVPHLGATARKAWTKRPSAQTPADRANVALMTEGGFVPQLAEQQKIAAARQLAIAWQRVLRKEAGVSDWRKLITSSLRRPIEALQKPIFEEWIPNVKTAAYLHEAAAVLRRDPGLLNDDTARGIALRGVAQQIDARFGEKFYGSMFWNRYLKDTAIGSFLSLGWNQGFVHQFGGAAMQAVTKPLGLLPSFKPSPGRVTRRKATNAITFALAYLGSAALINGLMTLAYTGEQPSGLDFAFARTGGLNPDGTPRRLANMFYLREGWMLAKHIEERGGNVLSGAYEMFTNKLMFEPFKELLNNRDYYGYNIYDENAPVYRQMWQAFQHTMGEQTNPMSISGAKHAAELSAKPFPTFEEALADPSKLFEALTAKGVGESVMGFGPAPGYLEKTAIQNRIGYLYGEHVAPAEKTYDEGLKSPDKMSARTAIMVARQNHDQKALSEANARGRAAGLTQTYMNNLAKVPTDIYLFSRLPDADQKAILRDASPDEYKRYFSKAKQTVKNDIYRARGAGAAVSP